MVDYDDWLFDTSATGTVNFTSPDVVDAQQLANAYIFNNGDTKSLTETNYTAWYSSKQVAFHETLLASPHSVDTTAL